MKGLYNVGRGIEINRQIKRVMDSDDSLVVKGVKLASTTSTAWKNVRELYGVAKAKACYTVAVSDSADDYLYPLAMKWIGENMADRQRRALVARIRAGKVAPTYDGNREQFLTIDGHRVSVVVASKGLSDTTTPDAWDMMSRYKAPERILFTALTAAGRDAVVRLLDGLYADWMASRQGLPDLHLWTRHGWTHSGSLHPRPLESVVLAPGQMERIISTLEAFDLLEERYLGLGIPWHLGLLFHGPPGTGKSSVARAIASHLGRDLYYISLASVENDEALFGAVASIPPGAIMLLEDVDTMGAATANRETGKLPSTPRGVTMSGVLNVLDGVMTPHGLLKILSTNHLERLDPAIYRRGRVDLVEEIGFATAAMAEEIFRYAFPDRPIDLGGVMAPETSPAKVVGAIKPHLTDPAAAEGALRRLSAGDDEGVFEASHSVVVNEGPRARRSPAPSTAPRALTSPPEAP